MISLRDYALAYVQSLPKDADSVREFDAVVDQLIAVKELRAFLSDSSVPLPSKKEALKTAFPKAEEATVNFLLLLIKDDAIHQLESLKNVVRQADAEKHGARHAVVTSAIPLKEEDLARIAKTLHKKFGSAVRLEEKTDPSLLAGFAVAVGDWTLDASLKGKLDRLQHALIV